MSILKLGDIASGLTSRNLLPEHGQTVLKREWTLNIINFMKASREIESGARLSVMGLAAQTS
jgi:hypothetical protein